MSGKYIVVFKDEVTKEQIDNYISQLNANGGELNIRYDTEGGILNGFAATIPDQYFQSLQGDSLISYIEPDGVVTIQ